MSNEYITSDLHINHRMVAKLRGFSTGEDLDDVDLDLYHETLIINWNSKIDNSDRVYILGDVCLTGNIDLVSSIVNQLNGEKILIAGNHDKKNLKKESFRNMFSKIRDYYELNYNRTKFCMSHYPMEYWNCKHRGSAMLHGHLHSTKPFRRIGERIMDVGLEGNNLFPWSIKDIYELMLKIEYSTDDHHTYRD